MRWSDTRGDAGSWSVVRQLLSSLESDKTDESEIPCRVRHHLPRAEATPHVNPAHNGEPLTGFERSAEAECRGKPSASSEVWPRND
jgi:hypothetical protein